MDTLKAIKKKKQHIARSERQLAIHKIKTRKAEIRQKIAFGALVIKANMDAFSKDVILGALIHARQDIEKNPAIKTLFQSIGQAAFMDYEEDKNDNNTTTNH